MSNPWLEIAISQARLQGYAVYLDGNGEVRFDAPRKAKTATPPKPCGRGWVGTKPPGCSRSGKGEKKAPAAKEPKPKTAKGAAKPKPEEKPPKAVEQGGKLAAQKPGMQAGKGVDEETKKLDPLDEITAKYAKQKPTKEDADAWINETARKVTENTPENVERRFLQEEVFTMPDKEKPATMQEAEDRMVKNIADYRKLNKQRTGSADVTVKNFGIDHDINSPESLAAAKKKIVIDQERKAARAKSEKTREKALADVEKLQLKAESDYAMYQSTLKKVEQYNSPPKRRRELVRETLQKSLNEKRASIEQERQNLDNPRKKGAAATIVDEASKLPSSEYMLDKEDYKEVNYTRIVNERVQEYLKQEYEKAGGLDNALGVKPNPSREQLKAAYRKAASKAHPDAGGTNEKFREVNEAYNTLKTKYGFDSLDVRQALTRYRADGYDVDIFDLLSYLRRC